MGQRTVLGEWRGWEMNRREVSLRQIEGRRRRRLRRVPGIVEVWFDLRTHQPPNQHLNGQRNGPRTCGIRPSVLPVRLPPRIVSRCWPQLAEQNSSARGSAHQTSIRAGCFGHGGAGMQGTHAPNGPTQDFLGGQVTVAVRGHRRLDGVVVSRRQTEWPTWSPSLTPSASTATFLLCSSRYHRVSDGAEHCGRR